MNLIKKVTILTTLIIILLSSNSFAGGKSGQFGIGLTVAEASPVYIFHYWASDNLTISPELSHNKISDPAISRTNFGLTLAVHQRPTETLRPFFGFGFNYDVASSNGESFSDLYFGPQFGAEYFFSDNFSVTGAFQFVVITTDDIMSPALLRPGTTYYSTAQLLTVQYYF